MLIYVLMVLVGAAAAWFPPAVPPEAKALEIGRLVNSTISAGGGVVRIPQGDYHFNNMPLYVVDARNVTIIGEGTVTLWFRVGAGVLIDRSVGVTVRNIIIDYDPPPLVQATVQGDATIAQGEVVVNVSTDQGFMDPLAFVKAFDWTTGNARTTGPLWFRPPLYELYGWCMDQFSPSQLRKVDGGMYEVRAKVPGPYGKYPVVTGEGLVPRRGDKLAVVIRLGFTLHTRNSTKCTFDAVTIHSASHFAVTEFDGQGGHVYRNVRVVRRPGSGMRLFASNADIFHSSGCRNGPLVDSCEFSYGFDDYINVHNHIMLVSERLSSTSLVVVDPRQAGGSWKAPPDYPYGTTLTMTNVRRATELDFYALNTMQHVERAQVASLAQTDDPLRTARAKNVTQEMNHRGALPTFPAIEVTGRVWLVTFTAPLANGVDRGTLVDLRGWDNGGAVVQNTRLHGGAFGVRWKSPNGVFRNNTWEDAMSFPETGFEVTMLQRFVEGPLYLNNITVTNNTFTRTRSAAELFTACRGFQHRGAFTHGCGDNVTFAGNTFTPP